MTLNLEKKNFINMKAISINDIDINETVVSNKFPFHKQDFEYFIVCKNILKFFKLEARKFHFSKYKIFFQSGIFYFSSSESYFLKY